MLNYLLIVDKSMSDRKMNFQGTLKMGLNF